MCVCVCFGNSLAVKYLFLTNDGHEEHHRDLVVEPFDALSEQNDYEVRTSIKTFFSVVAACVLTPSTRTRDRFHGPYAISSGTDE